MSASFNILLSIPEVAAIEQSQLQVYCNEWVKRPLAQKLGIDYLMVDSGRMLQVVLESERAVQIGAVTYIPFDELVGYIIDRHFTDSEHRRRLLAELREVRKDWLASNYGAEVVIGRVGTYYLVCKNPACGIGMETAHKGVEGGTVNCPSCELTCPECGQTNIYSSADLRLWFGDE